MASVRFADLAPKQLVRRYRKCMQIKESFRDLKSQHFGEGLERSRFEGTDRFTVLALIAALAAFLLWLLGTAAEGSSLHQRLHPGNGKRRDYSRLLLARLLLVLDDYADALPALVETIGSPDQWVANDDDALLVE